MKGCEQISAPIIKINLVSDGQRPLMGPIPAIPIRIDAETLVNQVVLEILPDAAAELVAELSKHLQARGSP